MDGASCRLHRVFVTASGLASVVQWVNTVSRVSRQSRVSRECRYLIQYCELRFYYQFKYHYHKSSAEDQRRGVHSSSPTYAERRPFNLLSFVDNYDEHFILYSLSFKVPNKHYLGIIINFTCTQVCPTYLGTLDKLLLQQIGINFKLINLFTPNLMSSVRLVIVNNLIRLDFCK